MNPSLDCPTLDEWREFASARLARERRDSMDGHLEACAACQETLGALDGSTGPLARVVAGLGQQPLDVALAPDADPTYRQLVQRAKGIRSPEGAEGDSAAISSRSAAAEGVLPPGTVLGAYVLGESIGAGGMGRVYKAVHQPMRRTVAVKVLSPRWPDCQEARGRFRREVESAARLSHPHVVTAFDAGQSGGHHYLVMEYVPGRNLAEVVRQSGPLPLRTALEYVLQAARGLEHAHRMGIVHRDIKPSNLLLDERAVGGASSPRGLLGLEGPATGGSGGSSAGTVKVLDLGIARAPWAEQPEGDLTAAQALLGTAAFMAPEQAANPRRADHRADVYSLGCTLFYLLTGQNVYQGETAMELVLAHREQPIASLAEHRADCPEVVDALFRRMVAKRPDERVASMREVIEEIERQLETGPAEASDVRNAMLPTSIRRSSAPRAMLRSIAGRPRAVRNAAALALAVVVLAGIVLASIGKLPWMQNRPASAATAAGNEADGQSGVEITPVAEKTRASNASTGEPAKQTSAADTGVRHINFLDGIDPRRQALSGRWEWDGQALTSPVADAFADLALPGKPPEEYVLTIAAERKSGSDALRLGLVSGDRSFVVVFDSGGTTTSFGMLEGAGPGQHATAVRNTVFWKDRPVTVRAVVRTRDKRTQLDVYVDGERLVAWAGETASLAPPTDAPKGAALFVGALKSSFRITRLELTPLVNGRPAPRWKTPPRTPEIEMVKIEPGKFQMGASHDDKDAAADQKPRHEVEISRPFLLGKHEEARDEFIEVMDLAREARDASVDGAAGKGSAPEGAAARQRDQQGRLPVVGVSWLTAVDFCNQLSLRHGLEPYYAVDGDKVTIAPGRGNGFRLPTEAEWEYACRAGTQTKWHFGDDPRLLDDFEWHAGNSRGRPQPVGTRKPNPWGLCDMHGNVPEWCWDRYDASYYARSEASDPPGSSRGDQRVVRGGSASQRAAQTASASRNSLGVTYGTVDPKLDSPLPRPGTLAAGSRGVGIRVARSAE